MHNLIIIDDAPVTTSRVYLGHTPLSLGDTKIVTGLNLGPESSRRVAALFTSGFDQAATVTLNGHSLTRRANYVGTTSAIWSGWVPTGTTGVSLQVNLPASMGYIALALYIMNRCRSDAPVSNFAVEWATPNGTGTFTTDENLTGVPSGAAMVATAFPLQNNYTMGLSSPNISSDGQVANTILGGFMDSGHGIAPSSISAEVITYTVTKTINGFANLAAAAFR